MALDERVKSGGIMCHGYICRLEHEIIGAFHQIKQLATIPGSQIKMATDNTTSPGPLPGSLSAIDGIQTDKELSQVEK